MYGGPLGPGFDVFSFLLPAVLIGGLLYLVVSLLQSRGAPPRAGSGGLENPALKTLYTLAVAVLVSAFVGFGIEVFYPSPEFPRYPEEEMMFGPVEGEGPTPEMREAQASFQREMEVYERELAEHNRVASVAAVGAAILLLVVGLIPRVGRLPAIGDGLTLGGVLTLAYGTILAIQSQNELLRFLAVAVGLVVLLVALYMKSRTRATSRSDGGPRPLELLNEPLG